MKNIIVIYHKNCPDGMGSAAVAYKKFGDNAEYIAYSFGDEVPAYVTEHTDKTNTEIYTLDICLSDELVFMWEKEFKKLMIIDHHVSRKDTVIATENGIFDNTKSGAMLTYIHFFGEENIPNAIKMLQVIDLNVDGYADLDLISYINSIKYEIPAYLDFIDNYDAKLDEYRRLGAAINSYVSMLEEMCTRDFDLVEFEGYTIPAVNICFDINTKSRILAKLYTIMPPFAMSYRYDEGQWKVSLRGDGSIDLSVLAAKYGGGGHRSSCGFSLPANGPLPFAIHKKERGIAK